MRRVQSTEQLLKVKKQCSPVGWTLLLRKSFCCTSAADQPQREKSIPRPESRATTSWAGEHCLQSSSLVTATYDTDGSKKGQFHATETRGETSLEGLPLNRRHNEPR